MSYHRYNDQEKEAIKEKISQMKDKFGSYPTGEEIRAALRNEFPALKIWIIYKLIKELKNKNLGDAIYGSPARESM